MCVTCIPLCVSSYYHFFAYELSSHCNPLEQSWCINYGATNIVFAQQFQVHATYSRYVYSNLSRSYPVVSSAARTDETQLRLKEQFLDLGQRQLLSTIRFMFYFCAPLRFLASERSEFANQRARVDAEILMSN